MAREIDVVRFVRLFGDKPMRLPDGDVIGSTGDDWPVVLETMRTAGWRIELYEYELEPDVDGRVGVATEHAAVWPASAVQVNFFPGDGGVAFDIDLREFTDQRAADGLAALIRLVSRTTGRDIAIREEGSSGEVVLTYSGSTDEFTFRSTPLSY
ncbi:hypothetical protein VD659_09635 [Herbiconiux sp. 11R-BC]|uniref:hypothetical protein n=1 Tax=Herbiconiux sp. 11R-BC TaxID=3111637 RepID=UPI003C0265A7